MHVCAFVVAASVLEADGERGGGGGGRFRLSLFY